MYFTLTAGLVTVECIPDDMSSLAMEIRMDSGLVGTHMYHLKAYKDTIVGKDLVQWLMVQKSMSKDYCTMWVCTWVNNGHTIQSCSVDKL